MRKGRKDCKACVLCVRSVCLDQKLALVGCAIMVSGAVSAGDGNDVYDHFVLYPYGDAKDEGRAVRYEVF